MRQARALAREAWASARSQPVATALTVVMVAGMVIAALLTTGQTAAAERAALGRIDAVGTRSIIVRAQEAAGLTVEVLDRVGAITEIESAIAFGPITDVRNALVPGAPPTGVRPVFGDLAALGVHHQPGAGAVLASRSAGEALGLAESTGGVITSAGRHLTVRGEIQVPEHLRFLEPLAVLTPADDDVATPVSTLVLLTSEPGQVAAVTGAVAGLLGVTDPSTVTIETSAALAGVRAAVSGELGTHGRAMVLVILAVAGVLVAANLFGLVQLRRKDFGRRRALGASQLLITALLLTQTAMLAVIGSVLGTAAALVALRATGHPLPGPDFAAAVAVAATLTALLAATAPAIGAARREPLFELRVA